jgi:anti-sigma factor RsiW
MSADEPSETNRSQQEHQGMTERGGDAACHDPMSDLMERYVAGRLPEREAERFEAHYFGCDTCWAAVQRAVELRAAFATMPAEEAAPVRPAGRGRAASRGAWRSVLAAAALATIVVGTWHLARQDRDPAPVLRNGAAELAVTLRREATTLRADWAPVPGAEAYHVRLFTAAGTLVLEPETADTSWVLDWSALPAAATEPVSYLEVRATDPLRQVLARSGLLEIPAGP